MGSIGHILRFVANSATNGIDRSHHDNFDPVRPVNSPSAFGAALRERRRELKLTQDDLALAIGVHRKVIGQLESGKNTVRLEIVLNAARALGLNIGVEARGEPGA
jgi:HTH-type transcriptional regulator / antitoxin HipB